MQATQAVPAARFRGFSRWQWRLWGTWIAANVVGEVVGFGAAGTVIALAGGAIAESTGVRQLGLMAGLTALVAVLEGSAVAAAQWPVLRRLAGSLSRRVWWAATVLGGGLAWGAGMVLGTSAGDHLAGVDPTGIPVWMNLVGGSLVGALAGVVLSTAQWLALRGHVRGAGAWVPAHGLGWALGMVVAFWGMDRVIAANSLAAQIAGGAAVGLGMGAAAAAVTGLAVVRLRPRVGDFHGEGGG